MKIALVHDYFTQWGGAERVLKYFSEIYPEAPVYVIAKDKELTQEFLPGKTVITSFLQDFPGMPQSIKYYMTLLPKAVESFDLHEYDVILSSSSAYAKGVITRPPQKHVCYLHTPTRYLTSDKEEYLEEAEIPLPFIGRPVVRQMLGHLQRWDLQASKRPDCLITNSKYIAERTKKYYGRTPNEVVFPPVDTSKFTVSSNIGDYWLVLGRNESYKRTDLAVLAANRLGLKLKVVGGGTDLARLKELSGSTIEFLGRVSDDQLADLYSQAIGLIFPPKEDAGMTPLESMAAGRPVIAYGQGGALESIKPGITGEFFKDQTVDSLVEALKNFKPEKYDPKTIRDHAMQFDVEIFKEKIKTIVESQIRM
jgi:glycosyltransferase involved in cell wall biosynthesis